VHDIVYFSFRGSSCYAFGNEMPIDKYFACHVLGNFDLLVILHEGNTRSISIRIWYTPNTGHTMLSQCVPKFNNVLHCK